MKVYNYISLRVIWQAMLILLISVLASPKVLVAQKITPVNPQRDEQPLIVNTDLITLNVSVTDDYGRAITGLGKSAFTIFDNKELQDISFFSDEDAAASISIVFDTSGSMTSNKIAQAKESLAYFIQTSHNQDEFFLIDFNSRAYLLLDKTRDADAILKKFTYVQPQGNTALYDAAYLGIEKVMRGASSRKIVLLISDGEDNNSRFTFKELKQQLQESGVIIYAIGTGGYFSSIKGGINGREILKELASTSGGKAFFPNGEDEMNDVFSQIALEIRHLYSIGYYPSDFSADGKWRRLKVKVKFPEGAPRLSVRSREGYYAGIKP